MFVCACVCVCGRGGEGGGIEVSNAADSLTSHQYKSYMVLLLHRILGSTEVQLGMCVCVCVRERESVGGGGGGEGGIAVSSVTNSLTSHQYKSYMVLLLHRIRGSTEVQLGMCVCVHVRERERGWGWGGGGGVGGRIAVSSVANSLTSHQYKSYMVLLIHRIRGSTEVQLDMCV